MTRLEAMAVAVGGALLILAGCADPGKQDSVAGAEHVCSSCHGMEGKSVSPTFPRLAGQQKVYIATELKAFQDHTRADPHAHTYMWGMAAQLTQPTIEGLAAYYASQTPVPGTPGDPAEMAAGQKIYQEGIADRGVPACFACHGEKAEGGDGGAAPRLGGQHRSYLESQLGLFATNVRANETMHDNAKNLTKDEMRQLAAYLAAQ